MRVQTPITLSNKIRLKSLGGRLKYLISVDKLHASKKQGRLYCVIRLMSSKILWGFLSLTLVLPSYVSSTRPILSFQQLPTTLLCKLSKCPSFWKNLWANFLSYPKLSYHKQPNLDFLLQHHLHLLWPSSKEEHSNWC